MTSVEVRMTRMSILMHYYPHPVMPLLEAAGMSTMRFRVAAEMPPRLQAATLTVRLVDVSRSFPRIILSNRRRAGFGWQSECSIPRTATYPPAKAVSPDETESGPDTPLLTPLPSICPAVHCSTCASWRKCPDISWFSLGRGYRRVQFPAPKLAQS